MKKSKEYTEDLVPVFMCLGSLDALPSLELVVNRIILEAQEDLIEHIKSLVTDQETIKILENIELE